MYVICLQKYIIFGVCSFSKRRKNKNEIKEMKNVKQSELFKFLKRMFFALYLRLLFCILTYRSFGK